MRNTLRKRTTLLSAIVLAAGLGACSDGSDAGSLSVRDADNRLVTTSSAKADARADDAEARARAAEAQVAAAEAKAACEKDRQQASNRGAIVGGVAGAVVGSQVAGDGAKSEGGAIGGVAGVLAGRQIAKKDHRC